MIRIPNLLTGLFKDKTEVAIFFTAFLVEVAFGLYLVYMWGSTLVLDFTYFHHDLMAHIYIPRTVIDNGAYSKLANLGTVWLPLPHMLFIPFVAINVLYTTGLAGTLVNGIMIGGSCVLLYRLVEEKSLSIVASALFLGNVYTLVQGASAYTLPTGVFFILLSVFYFKCYWEKDDVREFMKCSLALILATLSRYEAWIVTLLIALFFVLRELKNKRTYRLVYVQIPFWGIFAWLFWNLAIFRDPFIWAYGPFPGISASGGVWERGYGAIIADILSISVNDIITHGLTPLYKLSGYLWILTLITTLLLLIRKDKSLPFFRISKEVCMTFVLLAPSILLLLSAGHRWEIPLENLLYISLPGLVLPPLFVAHHCTNNKRTKLFLVLCLVTLTLITTSTRYSFLVKEINVLSHSSYTVCVSEVASIKEVATGSNILMGSGGGGLESPARFLSTIGGFSPSVIVDEYDMPLFAYASEEPWRYCEYVLIDKMLPDREKKATLMAMDEYYGSHILYNYYFDLEWREEFLQHYELPLETEYFFLFALKVGGRNG